MKRDLFVDVFGSFADSLFDYPLISESLFSETWSQFYTTKVNEDSYIIKVDVPGFEEKDLSLEITSNRHLRLFGERDDGSRKVNFDKSWALPKDSSLDETVASYKAGQITLLVPRKLPTQSEVKKLNINS
jgi:HSP20 family molecular chaperone IbpA